MKPLKFEPLLKSTIWGGNKIIAFKHLDIKQEKVGESWEISGVPGNESIVADGEMKGKKLNEVVAELKENFLGAENYKRFGNDNKTPVGVFEILGEPSKRAHTKRTSAQWNQKSSHQGQFCAAGPRLTPLLISRSPAIGLVGRVNS